MSGVTVFRYITYFEGLAVVSSLQARISACKLGLVSNVESEKLLFYGV